MTLFQHSLSLTTNPGGHTLSLDLKHIALSLRHFALIFTIKSIKKKRNIQPNNIFITLSTYPKQLIGWKTQLLFKKHFLFFFVTQQSKTRKNVLTSGQMLKKKK